MAEHTATPQAEEIRHLNVLVAEGNSVLQQTIVEVLKGAGVQNCSAVASGADAWQAWKRRKDLGVIICADNLPEMAGMDFLKRIRADQQAPLQPAFILISAEAAPQAQQEADAAGADAFLRKPFSTEDLVPAVLAGVRRRKEMAGGDFAEQALQAQLIKTRHQVELVFERYTTTVDCEELHTDKCVIRVSNNYGLGTMLTMRFARPNGEDFYSPVKGMVTKTERIPREYGQFLLHVQFSGPVKDQHGIHELVRLGGGGAD